MRLSKTTKVASSLVGLVILVALAITALFPPVHSAVAGVITADRVVGPLSGGGLLQVAAVESTCDDTAEVCMDVVAGSSTSLTFPASADDLFELSVVKGQVYCTSGAAPTATVNDYPFPQDYVGKRTYTAGKLACRTDTGVQARLCVVPCEN